MEIQPIRVDSPPKLDGILDDAAWKQARGYDGFKSFHPEFGKQPKVKTIGYAAYDANNLYFGFMCYDSEPDKIIASVRKRDTIHLEDFVAVALDSHNDGQNAYFLLVNPMGIQGDGIMNSDGAANLSQDFVWHSAGRKLPNGFSVEMKIPLVSIRFKKADVVNMRVSFLRKITRYSEQYVFPPWKLGSGPMLDQFAACAYQNLNCKRIVEFLPSYTFSYRKTRDDAEQMAGTGESNPGLTGKIGLTSEMTLDITVNPDFSQIESDEGQIDVNVRTAPLYKEKRSFFLEGLEHFTYAGCGVGSPISKVVHTRNIMEPKLGLKISGKIGKNGIINSLFAIDRVPQTDESDDDDYYGILRYKYLMGKDSYFGALYTAKDFSGGFNRASGMDSRMRINGHMLLDTFFLYSIQKNADAPNENEGFFIGCNVSYESRKYFFNFGYHDVSDGFHLDLGKVNREGIRRVSGMAERNYYPSSGFLKRITMRYNGYLTRDTIFRMNEYSHNFESDIYLSSAFTLSLGYSPATEVYGGKTFDTDSFHIMASGRISTYLDLEFYYENAGTPRFDPTESFRGKSQYVSLNLRFQPSETFSTEFAVKRYRLVRDSTGENVYDYGIYRNKTTFQPNKYLSLRAIIQYNSLLKRISPNCLLEFNYIPGTVIHLGYGSTYERERQVGGEMIRYANYKETSGRFFFKASYLFRF
ncbi:MAG: carbohydrate binding family 9 domain-containing protein [bacterium]|nr:carbohydrate binding family 9 domain-containing protein [bacterium]